MRCDATGAICSRLSKARPEAWLNRCATVAPGGPAGCPARPRPLRQRRAPPRRPAAWSPMPIAKARAVSPKVSVTPPGRSARRRHCRPASAPDPAALATRRDASWSAPSWAPSSAAGDIVRRCRHAAGALTMSSRRVEGLLQLSAFRPAAPREHGLIRSSGTSQCLRASVGHSLVSLSTLSACAWATVPLVRFCGLIRPVTRAACLQT